MDKIKGAGGGGGGRRVWLGWGGGMGRKGTQLWLNNSKKLKLKKIKRKLKAFSLRSAIRQGCLLSTIIQYSIRSPGHSNLTRKRNKRTPNWKERNKTVTISRWHDSMYVKTLKNPSKINRINKFTIVARYKVNIQNFIVLIYNNNENQKIKLRKQSHSHASKIIKYLRTNLTKEVKHLYSKNYKTLKKEIEKDTQKIRGYTMVIDWKDKYN